MRAIALVDLDDTLFQTLRKCPPDVPAEALSALARAPPIFAGLRLVAWTITSPPASSSRSASKNGR